ncbi:MAG TPA: hypothetical protein PLT87_03900 [Spirochaetales bacterium]|nr:hypothetical protein [Spirochaetales bacterium]
MSNSMNYMNNCARPHKKARAFAFFLIQFFIIGCLFPVFAQDDTLPLVTADQLIDDAAKWDGKRVEFEGEVIGDIMARGGYVWINVLDGDSAIGIWLPKSLVPNIRFTGQYFAKGDKVEIHGIMHRACQDHGGDLDIHADYAAILEEGTKVLHPIQRDRLWWGITLGVASILSVGFWRYRERQLLLKRSRE